MIQKPILQSLKKRVSRIISPFFNFGSNLPLGDSPDYCELIVTEKCFFRCKMCDMWKRIDEDVPSLNKWKHFVTEFKKTVKLPFRIGICGGETLTYPYLAELIKYCKSLGFEVFITTNAFLLSKKKADELYNAGLREYVISLDSIDEKTHDEIRGIKGSYKKVMEAIDLLSTYEERISINLLSVIMSPNVDTLLALAKWAEKNQKINSINFNAITEPLCSGVGEEWYKDSSYSNLWPSDSSKVSCLLEELIEMKKKGAKIGNSISQLNAFNGFFKHPELFVKNGSCHMGKTVSINSEGYVFMCHYFDSIGNIKKDDLSNIWKNEKANKIRKQILECEKNCKMLINCNYME